ncbi:TadE family protein [Paenibacillus andongensis]|uniref:TadE family protein n=1 Tax=Paenibacillus andongensis TaxID=2975482 RepID=UPI0021BB4F4D|nr:TadE family protein [Paenibacillus andongensis]
MRHRRLLSFRVSEDGSFTLEASLVFPLILLCTVTLLFVGMYAYQNVFVQQLARTTAERLAFTWTNSHKDLVTGNFNPSDTDGLYWRLTRDNVTDLFGMLSGGGTTEVNIPSSRSSGHVESKLVKPSALLPQGVTGTAKYANYLFDHQIEVKLKKSFLMPVQFKRWLDSEQTTGRAVSHVVESVELIRLTDITRTYFKAIKGRISPQKARDALVEPIQDDLSGPSVSIQSERQAAAYLKSLVGGTEVILKTASGKSRTIDALDARGVGHQAFYNMTEFQLRTEQMPKDIELLDERAQVKGIVWHFFKKDASGNGMPSNSFRKELERKGIVVVIHK